MLKHIDMFRIKGNAETKKQDTQMLKDKLDELKIKIPEVSYLAAGINISASPSSFDLVLTNHFVSLDAFDIFRSHFDHHKLVKINKEKVSEIEFADYAIYYIKS